jgi:hypothetical protein
VELQLVSFVKLLRVAFVELELDHVLQEEDEVCGGRGGRRPGRGARRSSMSSFLTPVDGGWQERWAKYEILEFKN